MLYRFDRVRKSYGPKEVLREVTWQHNPGEKVGLIGRNGAGKTTLLRMVLGREEPDAGAFDPGQRRPDLDGGPVAAGATSMRTLHDFVGGRLRGPPPGRGGNAPARARPWRRGTTPRPFTTVTTRLSHRFENEGGYEMVAEVEKALSGLGFDKADFTRSLSELSGGQKNRAMLARAMLSQPDVLLLDEPTNHLDFQAVEFLEEYLARSRRAYLVVTHDRRLPRPGGGGDRGARERPALRVLRRLHARTAARRPSAVLTATRAFEKQQDFIEKEKEYIRRNIAGVNSRQAKGRRTKLERVERLERPAEDTTSVAFRFDAARIGGRIFLRAQRSRRGLRRRGADRRGASPSSCCAGSGWRSSGRTAPARRRC